VPTERLIDELFSELDRWIEAGMQRPRRPRTVKPAAQAMPEAAAVFGDTR
jgi:hypothetical protein